MAAEDFWLTGEDNGAGDAAADASEKVSQNLGKAAQSAQVLQKVLDTLAGGQVKQALASVQQAFDPQRISAANAAWQKAGGLLQAAGSRPSIPPPLPAQPPPLPTGTAAIPSALQLISQQQSPVPQIGLKKQGPANIALQKQGDADIDLQMQKKGKGPRTQAEIDAEIDRAMGLKKEAAVAEGVDGGGKGGKDKGKGKEKDSDKDRSRGGGTPDTPGGLLKVQIVQPLPLPVVFRDQGGGRQAAFGGAAGGAGGGGGMGSALGAAQQAGNMLQGLASSSEYLSKNLTGSMQIFAASIAQVAAPAIIRFGYNLQLAGAYIRGMDADTRKAIATKLEFAGAIAAAGFAASKAVTAFNLVGGAVRGVGAVIAGIGLPGLAIALGAAGVAAAVAGDEIAAFLPPGIAEPVAKFGAVLRSVFGEAMASAGPALMQLGQSLMEVGKAALPVVVDAGKQLAGVMASLAPMLGEVLVATLQTAAGVISSFAQGLQVINNALGGNLPTILATAAGAFVTFRIAATAATAALSITPLGGFTIAVGALVTALGLASQGMSDVSAKTAELTDHLGNALSRADKLAAAMERVANGGKVEKKDLALLSTEDEARLRGAGQDKEKQKAILEDIAKKAREQSDGMSVEQIDEEEAKIAAKVRRINQSGIDNGIDTDEKAREYARRQMSTKREAARRLQLAERALEQGGIDFSGKKPEDKAEGTGKGSGTPGSAPAGEGKEGATGRVPKGFNPAFAPPSSLTPQFSNIDQVRKQLQIASLQDPIERQLLELNRQMAQDGQEQTKRLGRIAQNTEQPGGLRR